MVDALLLPRADAGIDSWVSVGVVRPAAWSPIVRLFVAQTDQKATELPAAVSLVGGWILFSRWAPSVIEEL